MLPKRQFRTGPAFGNSAKYLILGGSPGRIRTSDPAVNSRLLYQLSYRGTALCGATAL
jgi:D-tyrosyl-tRNA(Tyr) deacylase